MESNIYKVYYNELLLYIGSTFRTMNERKNQHKHSCYKGDDRRYNMNFYQYIRDYNIDWNNLEWIVDTHLVKDKEEKLIIEKRYIEFFEPLCNKQIPILTNEERIILQRKYDKEYREKNKQIISEKHKQYYKNNKKIISERKNEKIECECGGRYTQGSKARHFRSNKHQEYLKM